MVRLLRLLTFSGSHPHISEQRPMKPEYIVDVILHGTLAREGERLMLLRLLRTYLAPYRRWLSVIVVLQFTATVAMLFLPSLNADIIDNGVARGDTGYIVRSGRGDARRLPAADRLLGRGGLVRRAHGDGASAATCGRRSSTGSARSPAARSRSSARRR